MLPLIGIAVPDCLLLLTSSLADWWLLNLEVGWGGDRLGETEGSEAFRVCVCVCVFVSVTHS